MRTIGKFYRDEILCLPKRQLKKVELPTNWGNTKLEEDLFGWKIHTGMEIIECRSKEESRYLKILLDYNMREVYVPKDDEYLKKILPKLEKLKKKIDNIINFYLRGVLDRRIRDKVKSKVYLEITK